MNTERWQTVERLFNEACEQPADRRDAWLDQACGGDADLREEVVSLLEADTADQLGPIVSVAARAACEDAAAPAEGRAVGPYRIVRELGRGGMGAVYLGERSDGLEQQVAIKMMRERLADPRLVERFESERRILARLEHSGIARLIDAGTTDDGTPYVAMEYVDGAPVDTWCRAEGLGVRERIELFCLIGEAVHYAHRNLVVHRDLKPSNVLVAKDGTPRLLDFGIAKLLDPAADDTAPATATAERLLTPAYASPEQVTGKPVTTASDVYSMGVMLYRLLAGRSPYTVEADSPDMARAICQDEPERPSTAAGRADDASGGRATARLRRELQGDLDNIVLRALRKEPARRYATAAELVDDLRRYLDGHPVSARPDTWRYRSGKFVRRNRGLVAGLVAAAVVLVAGAISTGVFAVGELRQRRVAERERAVAEAINTFLNDDLLALANPYQQGDREMTLREAIDEAAGGLADRFPGEPLVEAGVRMTLGKSYQSLGAFETATKHYERAAALRAPHFGAGAPQVLEPLIGIAGVAYEDSRYDDAWATLQGVVALRRRSPDPEHPLWLQAANLTALVHDAEGRVDEAIAAARESLALHREVLGDEHAETLTALNNLALMYQERGSADEAGPLLAEVLDTRRRVFGDAHPDTILSIISLAFYHQDDGRPGDAEPLYREAVTLGADVLGPDHPWQLHGESLLADLLGSTGRAEEAETRYQALLAKQRELFGEESLYAQRTMQGLAGVLTAAGRHDEAIALQREVMTIRGEAHGTANPRTVMAYVALTGALRAAGRCEEAVTSLGPRVAEVRAASDAPTQEVGRLLVQHGRCLRELGREAEARGALEAAREHLAGSLGEENEHTREAAALLADAS